MALLNQKNSETEKIVHLMITNKCDRNCKYCCNKQYDVNKIPIISGEELNNARELYLTGGEPFAYANPCYIADLLKNLYSNIERVIVYTNAYEFGEYLKQGGCIYGIDGLTISIKDKRDKAAFEEYILYNKEVNNLKYLRLYIFDEVDISIEEIVEIPCWYDIRERKWQKEFNAAPNSIFRRAAQFPEDNK